MPLLTPATVSSTHIQYEVADLPFLVSVMEVILKTSTKWALQRWKRLSQVMEPLSNTDQRLPLLGLDVLPKRLHPSTPNRTAHNGPTGKVATLVLPQQAGVETESATHLARLPQLAEAASVSRVAGEHADRRTLLAEVA